MRPTQPVVFPPSARVFLGKFFQPLSVSWGLPALELRGCALVSHHPVCMLCPWGQPFFRLYGRAQVFPEEKTEVEGQHPGALALLPWPLPHWPQGACCSGGERWRRECMGCSWEAGSTREIQVLVLMALGGWVSGEREKDIFL